MSDWKAVNAGDGAAWAKAIEGATFQGELLGRFRRRGEDPAEPPKYYYQISLTEIVHNDEEGHPAPTMGVVEKELVALSLGDLINIDERSFMEGLQKFVEGEGRSEVYIRFGAKVKRGAKSPWTGTVRARPMEQRAAKVA